MNEVFETALEIALNAHKGQVDKNGVAYITLLVFRLVGTERSF